MERLPDLAALRRAAMRGVSRTLQTTALLGVMLAVPTAATAQTAPVRAGGDRTLHRATDTTTDPLARALPAAAAPERAAWVVAAAGGIAWRLADGATPVLPSGTDAFQAKRVRALSARGDTLELFDAELSRRTVLVGGRPVTMRAWEFPGAIAAVRLRDRYLAHAVGTGVGEGRVLHLLDSLGGFQGAVGDVIEPDNPDAGRLVPQVLASGRGACAWAMTRGLPILRCIGRDGDVRMPTLRVGDWWRTATPNPVEAAEGRPAPQFVALAEEAGGTLLALVAVARDDWRDAPVRYRSESRGTTVRDPRRVLATRVLRLDGTTGRVSAPLALDGAPLGVSGDGRVLLARTDDAGTRYVEVQVR